MIKLRFYIQNRFLLACALCITLLHLLTGCSDETLNGAKTQALTIGLSLSTLANPFFVAVKEGAEKSAQQFNIKLLVMNAEDDPAKQELQIEELINQKVDLIILNPAESEMRYQSIEKANLNNIPVLTVDRQLAQGDIKAHIASDNAHGGHMAGEYLAELLNKTGKIVELTGIDGTSAAIERGKGFNAAIQKYNQMEVIARNTANFNRQQAESVFADILKSHPDIHGVFAHNDEMILGALAAAQKVNRRGNITFVGFDAIPDAISSIEGGFLNATVAQQPNEMGRLSIETAFKILQGQKVEAYIPVDLALINQ